MSSRPGHAWSKSERIQQLVQEMKAGAISKSELFAQLSQLQRASKTAVSSTSLSVGLEKEQQLKNSSSSSSEDDTDSDVSSARKGFNESAVVPKKNQSSTPSQRELILRLLEEKKRRRISGCVRDDEDVVKERKELSQEHQSRALPKKKRPSSASAASRRPEKQGDGEVNGLLARSRDYLYESRMSRLQAELREKQMAECTFKPKIRKMPDHYASGRGVDQGLTFDQRVALWKRRKAEEMEKKRQEKQDAELNGCTFHPKISKKSKAIRARTPVRGRPSPTSTLSSRSTIKEESFSSKHFVDVQEYQVEADGLNAHERLYRESKIDRLANLQEKARKEQEKQLRKECTFKPKLLNSAAFPVRSKYREEAESRRPSSAPGMRMGNEMNSEQSNPIRELGLDDDCTFVPQTNPIHPSMENAQVYLSRDVVTRLTQPLNGGYELRDENLHIDNVRDGRVMDMETYLATLKKNKKPGIRPSSASSQGTLQSFDQFLQRQQHMEKRRERRVQDVAKQVNPPHKPKLCRKSVEIANQRIKGDFLQRVARGAIRKEHENVRRKSRSMDPECTFQPQITKTAKALPSRTATEMSRGDSLRKETNARLMKLRVEQEELQDLTFTPEVLTAPSEVEGRLKVLTEPDTYVRRLQQKNAVHSNRKNKIVHEQEMKELEECTFKPQIHEAPAYVKRIVRSLSLTKPLKQAQEAAAKANARPDWR